MDGHFTFSKQDVPLNLGSTVPEARSQDMEAPQEGAVAPPTMTTVGTVEPCPTKTQGTDDIILMSSGCTPNDESPPAEPTTLPAEINLPGSAEVSLRGSTIMPSARIDTDTLKDLVTVQAASPAKAESWVVPTTASVDQLGGPLMPSDQVGGEKQCILMMTTSVGRQLGGHQSYLQEHHDCLSWGVAFRNPHMAASLLGHPKEKEVGHQDATAGKLTEGDLAEDWL